MSRYFPGAGPGANAPCSFKSAYVTPILKKPGLAEDDLQNYRPISNLSVISMLLESKLLSYLNCNNLLPENQSAYQANHSTETATAKIVSDFLIAFDHDLIIAALALLDGLRHCGSLHPTSQAKRVVRCG